MCTLPTLGSIWVPILSGLDKAIPHAAQVIQIQVKYQAEMSISLGRDELNQQIIGYGATRQDVVGLFSTVVRKEHVVD